MPAPDIEATIPIALRSNRSFGRIVLVGTILGSAFLLVGLFGVHVALNNKSTPVKPPLTEEQIRLADAIAEYSNALTHVDNTVHVDPLGAKPGYLQRLALAEASVQSAALNKSLQSGECNRQNETRRSCAMFFQAISTDVSMLEIASNAYQFALVKIDPKTGKPARNSKGALLLSRVSPNEAQALLAFRTWSGMLAQQDAQVNPSVDPVDVSQKYKAFVDASINFEESQGRTNTAGLLQQRKSMRGGGK